MSFSSKMHSLWKSHQISSKFDCCRDESNFRKFLKEINQRQSTTTFPLYFLFPPYIDLVPTPQKDYCYFFLVKTEPVEFHVFVQ